MRFRIPLMLAGPALAIAASVGSAGTSFQPGGNDEVNFAALRPRAYEQSMFEALPSCAQECVNSVRLRSLHYKSSKWFLGQASLTNV